MSKTVVLTGGAQGIGGAVLARLLADGHAVHVLDVEAPALDGARFVPCDLGDPGAIDRAVADLPGRVDCLLHVAGIANAGPAERVAAVNLLGLRHLTETLLARIGDGGSVVIVASSAGHDWRDRADLVGALLDRDGFESGLEWLRAHRDAWSDNPYKFSKQCAAAYTYRAVGAGFPRGVRVNCVNPGAVETRLTPEFRRIVGERTYDWHLGKLGRHTRAEEVAEVIVYLGLGPCSRVNGVEMVVDGGFVAGLVGGWIDPAELDRGEGV